MPSKQEIRKYLNLMARALRVADQFPAPFHQMAACQGYDQAVSAMTASLDTAWDKGLPALFTHLEQAIQTVELGCETVNYIRAAEICRWMDRRIRYLSAADTQGFSLYKLLPYSGDQPACIDSLNTNYAETGIQLHPRYAVTKFYDQQADKLRPLGNRDAFEGLNGHLQNICYTHWSTRCSIRHVVIPYEYATNKEDGPLRIAFCPMSCKGTKSLLKTKNVPFERGGVLFNGILVEGVKHARELRARFVRDWKAARDHGADIVFAPEMLGMAELEARSGKYNALLRQLYMEESSRQKKQPILTILPSFWRSGINTTTVVYQDGTVLGVQPKYTPFVNVGEGYMEALVEQEIHRLLVIHIPGVHRIVVMICADFLSIQAPETRRLICEELGATMIIVPAYSHGEQDFINLLPSLKSYGITVVWGDCCGAATPPRIVGACSIAGTDGIMRFGPKCKCSGVCKSNQSCLFLTDLPMRLTRTKPNAPYWDKPVEHIFS